MSSVNIECICGTSGSHGGEERRTDAKCFQHGTGWTGDEIAALNPAQRLLFHRYRSHYCGTYAEETLLWIRLMMEEAYRLEPGDPCIDRLAQKLGHVVQEHSEVG